jgi:hypothetical protein
VDISIRMDVIDGFSPVEGLLEIVLNPWNGIGMRRLIGTMPLGNHRY